MSVEVYNDKNEKINTVYTDKDGKYSIELEPYKKYKFLYDKEGVALKEQIVEPFKPLEKRDFSFDFVNEREAVVDGNTVALDGGNNLTDKLNLQPIYFDYNGYTIRESSKLELDKVVDLMKTHPTILLTVNSHTDSRGRDDFNMKLSQNRAQATVNYIINQGVSKDRVTGKGYGETRLLNHCKNGVVCSEAEQQLNRRSEFIIQFSR